jgi:uncharacterized repeat protein (TIGR01451 family)
VHYTIVASNAAAIAVSGVTVTDSFPATLNACSWTCSASSGGSCPANGSGNINAGVTLAASGSATFNATCTLAAGATGTLGDSASVSYGNDPNTANNSATDTDTIAAQADIAAALNDGSSTALTGEPISYTFTLTNSTNAAVSGVAASDTFAAQLLGCSWTCVASAGGSCLAASGSGNIATSVALAASGSATFSATCTLAANASGTVSNTATATYPNDPNPANNSATDTDTVILNVVFDDGYE